MKKLLKYILVLAGIATLFPLESGAQKRDARQRSAETIVADGLARLPATQRSVFDQVMGEIAATGEKGVELIAAMMVPAAEGKNAVFEYAISGVTAYVTAPGNESLREGVRRGLKTAIGNCKDNVNRAFLLSQLQLCSSEEDVEEIASYMDDPYLGDCALRALISTPGSEGYLLKAAGRTPLSQQRKRDLAYAFGQKRLAAAESILVGWLADAEPKTLAAVYHALAVCGSDVSVKPLGAAAKKAEYKDEPTSATHAYVDLLGNLVRRGDSRQALKSVRSLLKCRQVYVKGAALALFVEAQGIGRSMPVILKAVCSGDREYRFAALQTLGKGDDKIFAAVASVLPKCDAGAQATVIAWLGERGAASQIGAVIKYVDAQEPVLAQAAIEAAGRIGGEQALQALAGALAGTHAADAKRALLAFHGEIAPQVVKLLDSDDGGTVVYALQLAAERHMKVTDRVFELLKSSNEEVGKAAYKTLKSVVGTGDAGRLAALLDGVAEQHVGSVQQALIHALSALSKEEQYEKITGYMSKAGKAARYYPVLANTHTEQAAGKLLADFKATGDRRAFEALLGVNHPMMAGLLYGLAAGDKNLADPSLSRYAELIRMAKMTPEQRYLLVRRALELAPSPKVRERLIDNLKDVHIQPAMLFASRYLADNEIKNTAAGVVKNMVAKSAALPGGESVRKVLDEAYKVYRAWDDADAGYAVKEITGLLARLPESGFVEFPVESPDGWKPMSASLKQTSPYRRARAEKAADDAVAKNWSVKDGVVSFAGDAACGVSTGKEYENFELWLEWRSEGGAGIVVRSMPQIGLGAEEGYPYTTSKADNRAGEWNLLYVKVTDDRMTVSENGVVIADKAVLSDGSHAGAPVNVRGVVGLVGGASPAEFRGILINELPSTPVFELSPEEKAAGYEVLFDGRSLHKWTDNKTNYVPQDGAIHVSASYGGSGNLYTAKEYGNFNYRFEFRFMKNGVNNGIGIRTPMGVDAAYHGMEIQVLDHDDPIYKNLNIYQQHGSVYGVIPDFTRGIWKNTAPLSVIDMKDVLHG